MAAASSELIVSVSGIRGVVGRGAHRRGGRPVRRGVRGVSQGRPRRRRPGQPAERGRCSATPSWPGCLAPAAYVRGHRHRPHADRAASPSEGPRRRRGRADHRQPQPVAVERAQAVRPGRGGAARRQGAAGPRRCSSRAISAGPRGTASGIVAGSAGRSGRPPRVRSSTASAWPRVAGARVPRLPRRQRRGRRAARRAGCSPTSAARSSSTTATRTASFVHDPEPIPGPPGGRGPVGGRQTEAAVGFVLDPDADRLALIDEAGHLRQRGSHARPGGEVPACASSRGRWSST